MGGGEFRSQWLQVLDRQAKLDQNVNDRNQIVRRIRCPFACPLSLL
jgi:hypothetical protein